ncbi:isopropylmalate/homocitrate/citramalate synthase [Anaerobacterium chartisolvens]|uniref:Isopropylmalate/homocitrate/citramalate synthase n=1 Tax=Anaerobacterium chartisolvens TaxID=1297424 RepID=A0A369BEI0_9FIRM|nr:2-isopropylmalate synthase [Anaerobacterium chartisolvens]RCX18877.1 isopropylmalate/homocitrate/citramalate synthase [Anaerobacterium chartisolvens]
MIEFNKRTNTLEQTQYRYSLQDVAQPNLYREIFSYDEIPKCTFNHRRVPMHPADEIWITDTTFRDGQQSRAPYTVEQIVHLFDLLHKLGGPNGIIRQSEFFLYSDRDKQAVYKCQERGYRYPEVTSWIRATKSDFQLAKDMGMKESGILVSCSDYHIFKKLNMTRRQAMEHYMGIIKSAIEVGIKPRCHFEDITRADFYGFVVPFALELRKLMEESGVQIKIRACDTMGYGVCYPGAALPRSVPGIIYGLRHHAGFPSELIEWHGHNDFYKAVSNSSIAWMYGASSVNCSLLGIGERTGNTPLEAMVIEYAQLRGTTDGMDTTVITDIARYYEDEIGYKIPSRTPFAGKYFNVTQAGIHADGLLKDEEIYNIFDTAKILKRPIGVAINQGSGLAGIAHWINSYFELSGSERLDKKDARIAVVKEWVDGQYRDGRVTAIGDDELLQAISLLVPDMPGFGK